MSEPCSSTYRVILGSRGTVLIPVTRRLSGGLFLHASCLRPGLIVNNLFGAMSRISPKLIPGKEANWCPPMPTEAWNEWLERIAVYIEPINHFVVLLPREQRRLRFGLLLFNGRGKRFGFAKFTVNPPSPWELRALAGLSAVSLFWSPKLLTNGEIAGWTFNVTTPMPSGPHRPARLQPQPRDRVLGEIRKALATPDLPDNTYPMHGDFGPWNVRSVLGRTVVIDWEEAGLGPLAADAVWFSLNTRLLGNNDPTAAARLARTDLSNHSGEEIVRAARFWLTRHSRPEREEIDMTKAARTDLARRAGLLNVALEILAHG